MSSSNPLNLGLNASAQSTDTRPPSEATGPVTGNPVEHGNLTSPNSAANRAGLSAGSNVQQLALRTAALPPAVSAVNASGERSVGSPPVADRLKNAEGRVAMERALDKNYQHPTLREQAKTHQNFFRQKIAEGRLVPFARGGARTAVLFAHDPLVESSARTETLSQTEVGKHFKGLLEELKARHPKDPKEKISEDVKQAYYDLLECALAFSVGRDVDSESPDDHVLEKFGLSDKDPQQFELSKEEYEAVCEQAKLQVAPVPPKQRTREEVMRDLPLAPSW